MSILKRQINSSPNFTLFLIVITHNSSVNFLFWIKGSHQSQNFETFLCSGENLPNSSFNFLTHKPVFFLLLRFYSIQCHEITSLYFFRSNVIYFGSFNQSKCKFLKKFFDNFFKIHKILVISETTNQFFFKFCVTLQCHET